MAYKSSQIRTEIKSKVDSLSGFKESLMAPEFFARTQDSIAHLGFSVQMVSASAQVERQRRAVGVYLNSTVNVIFAYRLRPLDVLVDYNLALDKEEIVINKVLEAYVSDAGGTPFTINFMSASREVTDSQEYIIITLEFEVFHTI